MKEGKLKQILLITDGCSNEGMDPVAAAAMAPEYGVTINVIGILDDHGLTERGMQEVQHIAEAGGGIHQLVYSDHLPKTVQMVTRKAMNQTIQQVVNKELKHVLGSEEEVEALPPAKRGQVVEVVENLGENLALDVLILVDTSASMKNKIPAVKQALRDLSLSLQSRTGENRFSLWVYPGVGQAADHKMDWSARFSSLEKWFQSISPTGTTPTGPALELALQAYMNEAGFEEDGRMLRDHAAER